MQYIIDMKTIAIASITILLLFSCELWAPTTYNFYVEYNAVKYLESIYPMPQFAVYGGSVNKNKEVLVYKNKGRNSFTIATYKFQL